MRVASAAAAAACDQSSRAPAHSPTARRFGVGLASFAVSGFFATFFFTALGLAAFGDAAAFLAFAGFSAGSTASGLAFSTKAAFDKRPASEAASLVAASIALLMRARSASRSMTPARGRTSALALPKITAVAFAASPHARPCNLTES